MKLFQSEVLQEFLKLNKLSKNILIIKNQVLVLILMKPSLMVLQFKEVLCVVNKVIKPKNQSLLMQLLYHWVLKLMVRLCRLLQREDLLSLPNLLKCTLLHKIHKLLQILKFMKEKELLQKTIICQVILSLQESLQLRKEFLKLKLYLKLIQMVYK